MTGGPGAGKTTVARQFEIQGCAVVSADQLNHEVLTHPEVVCKITQWWGSKMLAPDGRISRQAVAKVVFEDDNELKKLTDLVHPLIAQREKVMINTYQADPDVLAVVLDVPLLIEVGQDKWCDFLVFVQAEEAARYQRLRENRGWEAQKAKKIEKSQLALDAKEKKGDYIVRNNSGIADLAAQVSHVLTQVLTSWKS